MTHDTNTQRRAERLLALLDGLTPEAAARVEAALERAGRVSADEKERVIVNAVGDSNAARGDVSLTLEFWRKVVTFIDDNAPDGTWKRWRAEIIANVTVHDHKTTSSHQRDESKSDDSLRARLAETEAKLIRQIAECNDHTSPWRTRAFAAEERLRATEDAEEQAESECGIAKVECRLAEARLASATEMVKDLLDALVDEANMANPAIYKPKELVDLIERARAWAEGK